MKITFLGTGTSQGIPVVNCNCEACTSDDPRDSRLRCSLFVEWNENAILVDTGPDLRQQALKNQIAEVQAILYTHEHYDHTAGLDEIRPFYFKNNCKPIDIYLQERVLDELKSRFGYIFKEDNYPGIPRVNQHVITPNSTIILKNQTNIEVIPVKHGNLDIVGYIFGSFAYLTDVSSLDPVVINRLKHIDTLVVSALQYEHHHSHLSISSAIELVEKISPKRTFLIHMSHRLGPVSVWSKNLPPNIYPAYDGLILKF